jgi:hypothetical protein
MPKPLYSCQKQTSLVKQKRDNREERDGAEYQRNDDKRRVHFSPERSERQSRRYDRQARSIANKSQHDGTVYQREGHVVNLGYERISKMWID